MPSLKDLKCSIELSNPQQTLEEYGSIFLDGVVETFVAVPSGDRPFAVRLTSKAFIAEGLAMFVYIDGKYQCNRNKHGLQDPSKSEKPISTRRSLVNFVVRQQEEEAKDGEMISRDWKFEQLNTASADDAPESCAPHTRANIGCIEVIVKRCRMSRIPKAPVQLDGPSEWAVGVFGLDGAGDWEYDGRSSRSRGNSRPPSYYGGMQPPYVNEQSPNVRVTNSHSRAPSVARVPEGAYRYGSSPIPHIPRVRPEADRYKDRTPSVTDTASDILSPDWLHRVTSDAYERGLADAAAKKREEEARGLADERIAAIEENPHPTGAWPHPYEHSRASAPYVNNQINRTLPQRPMFASRAQQYANMPNVRSHTPTPSRADREEGRQRSTPQPVENTHNWVKNTGWPEDINSKSWGPDSPHGNASDPSWASSRWETNEASPREHVSRSGYRGQPGKPTASDLWPAASRPSTSASKSKGKHSRERRSSISRRTATESSWGLSQAHPTFEDTDTAETVDNDNSDEGSDDTIKPPSPRTLMFLKNSQRHSRTATIPSRRYSRGETEFSPIPTDSTHRGSPPTEYRPSNTTTSLWPPTGSRMGPPPPPGSAHVSRKSGDREGRSRHGREVPILPPPPSSARASRKSRDNHDWMKSELEAKMSPAPVPLHSQISRTGRDFSPPPPYGLAVDKHIPEYYHKYAKLRWEDDEVVSPTSQTSQKSNKPAPSSKSKHEEPESKARSTKAFSSSGWVDISKLHVPGSWFTPDDTDAKKSIPGEVVETKSDWGNDDLGKNSSWDSTWPIAKGSSDQKARSSSGKSDFKMKQDDGGDAAWAIVAKSADSLEKVATSQKNGGGSTWLSNDKVAASQTELVVWNWMEDDAGANNTKDDADKTEKKTDKAEKKTDKAEKKEDKSEKKEDKGEKKEDKSQKKANKSEKKAKKNEKKAEKNDKEADKIEKKADGEETKDEATKEKDASDDWETAGWDNWGATDTKAEGGEAKDDADKENEASETKAEDEKKKDDADKGNDAAVDYAFGDWPVPTSAGEEKEKEKDTSGGGEDPSTEKKDANDTSGGGGDNNDWNAANNDNQDWNAGGDWNAGANDNQDWNADNNDDKKSAKGGNDDKKEDNADASWENAGWDDWNKTGDQDAAKSSSGDKKKSEKPEKSEKSEKAKSACEPNSSKSRLYSYRRAPSELGVPKPHWVFPPPRNLDPIPEDQKGIMPQIPPKFAREEGLSHIVNPGPPTRYTHARARPEYIDTFEHPYAVFRFKYRSREYLRKLLGKDEVPLEDAPKAAASRAMSVNEEMFKGMTEEEKVSAFKKMKEKLSSKLQDKGKDGKDSDKQSEVEKPTSFVEDWVKSQSKPGSVTSEKKSAKGGEKQSVKNSVKGSDRASKKDDADVWGDWGANEQGGENQSVKKSVKGSDRASKKDDADGWDNWGVNEQGGEKQSIKNSVKGSDRASKKDDADGWDIWGANEQGAEKKSVKKSVKGSDRASKKDDADNWATSGAWVATEKVEEKKSVKGSVKGSVRTSKKGDADPNGEKKSVKNSVKGSDRASKKSDGAGNDGDWNAAAAGDAPAGDWGAPAADDAPNGNW